MTRRLCAITLFAIAFVGWAPWPAGGQAVWIGRAAPEIAGGPWINSPPLTLSALKGRVVFVEFWTYG